jgi:hypothetical protein
LQQFFIDVRHQKTTKQAEQILHFTGCIIVFYIKLLKTLWKVLKDAIFDAEFFTYLKFLKEAAKTIC